MNTVTTFPYPVHEIENIWIPLSDGTRLAARIWLPEDAESKPVPAILEYMFGMQVRDAANNLSPKVIARYCHDLAVAFNSFYEHVKVLELGDEPLENSRLCIVNSFKITLEKALDLLGIVAPDRM